MKNKIIFLSIIVSFFIIETEAQNNTRVNAMNNEISDNLDLRAVASIFGDSKNLEDFERRLNDPEIQISNLDLNNDNEVDYLRVIETVEHNTHVVVIQSVLDRDVYQDVATIDIERNNNSVQVQFIGNEYMYGPNYIYEPVYYSTPLIYTSFWASNYRPYVSNWYWNYYPSYYYAWNPYPIYRYRNNIHLSLNFNNRYNYVNYRRSNLAVSIYNTRRTNAYERRYPNNAFSKRYSNYSNRYELDQKRGTRYSSINRNSTGRQYSTTSTRRGTQRDYSANRNTSSRVSTTPRTTSREYTENKSNNSRANTPSRNYNQNNATNSRGNSTPSRTTSREYNKSNTNSSRENTSSRTTSRASNPNNVQSSGPKATQQAPARTYTPRQESSTQRAQSTRQNTPSRGAISRPSTPTQRVESPKNNSNRQENNNSSRNNNRRI
ncbi:hypothetical protein AAGV33_06870 [Flavobacterium sp. FBOR7N2.3]|uniref:DUF3300 domain-containing protein n=1 Tax=Flavobacterium magnesitis TaxID=3138077 RepID=A0ABV4TJB2_9FLAO